MKVRAVQTFDDAEEGVRRMAGDEFEVSEQRFAEIEASVKGLVEKVEEARKPVFAAKGKERAEQ